MKLTIVISPPGITFGVLKKVVTSIHHIGFSSFSAAPTAASIAIIITTSTTR